MEAMGAAGGQAAASPWAAMATGQFLFVCTCVHVYYNVCNISAMCAFTHLCAFTIHTGMRACICVCGCGCVCVGVSLLVLSVLI